MLDFSKLTYSSEQNSHKTLSISLEVLKPKEPPVPVDRPSSATSNDRALAIILKRGVKSPHQVFGAVAGDTVFYL